MNKAIKAKEAEFKAKKAEAADATDQNKGKLYEHIRCHLSGPVNARLYLFTHCLRIVSDRYRDQTRHQRDSWSLDDFSLRVEQANNLFEEAYLLGPMFVDKGSWSWDHGMSIITQPITDAYLGTNENSLLKPCWPQSRPCGLDPKRWLTPDISRPKVTL